MGRKRKFKKQVGPIRLETDLYDDIHLEARDTRQDVSDVIRNRLKRTMYQTAAQEPPP